MIEKPARFIIGRGPKNGNVPAGARPPHLPLRGKRVTGPPGNTERSAENMPFLLDH